ncbi:MAG: aldo/keto reductase [Candidatus Hermodarchaeota archaeon]
MPLIDMKYRKLGRTQIEVSEIGLGTEYLYYEPKQIVVSVMQEAIKNGINYFDIIFNVSHYINNVSTAIKDYKEDIILTCHVGTIEIEGRAKRSRSIRACESALLNTLKLLGKESIDIVNIQFVKEKEYNEIISSKGLLGLALKLQKEGKVRYIALSTHDFSVGLKAIKSGYFDAIMSPINVVNNSLEERNTFLKESEKENIGLVAIKPFAGGKLLQKNRTVTIAKYQTGGISLKKKIPQYVTPAKCINYVLSQKSVSTTIPGIKNLQELHDLLSYIKATNEEKDFSTLIEDFNI